MVNDEYEHGDLEKGRAFAKEIKDNTAGEMSEAEEMSSQGV